MKTTTTQARAHISEDDVLHLNADVERVVAMGKWTRKCVERFVMEILPLFKRAYVDGKLDVKGRPIVHIHWSHWEAAAAKHADYVALRDALGWFANDSGVTRSVVWTFTRLLTMEAPRRALGSSWGIALNVARMRTNR